MKSKLFPLCYKTKKINFSTRTANGTASSRQYMGTISSKASTKKYSYTEWALKLATYLLALKTDGLNALHVEIVG